MAAYDISVKKKLIRAILTTSLGVLGFTCLVLLLFEIHSYRQATARSLTTAASIIAENSAGVLVFDDAKNAAETLAGLRAEPEVSIAALFDQGGKLYARFPAEAGDGEFPGKPGADGVLVDDSDITVFQPVMQGGARVGTIFIKGNLTGTYQRLRLYGFVLLAVCICSVGIAFLLSRFLQRRISAPLAALAETAHAVSQKKDFTVRATKQSADEFGELTDAFNAMLDEIGSASTALRAEEERFRTMADNIGQLAWMTEPDGFISWYNRRWFDYTGATLEEMQGWGWQKVHDPAHVERVTSKFKAALVTGKDWEDVFPLKGRDGNYRWFLSRAFPIRNTKAEIVRWFGTNTDITEQRLGEERLQAHAKRAETLSQVATELFLSRSAGGSLKTILPRITALLGADFYLHYMVATVNERLVLESAGGLTAEQRQACTHVAFGETLCGSCALQGMPLVVENVQHSILPEAAGARAAGVRAYACYPLRWGDRLLGTLAFATTTRDLYEPAELHFIHTVSDLVATSMERERLLTEVREARDIAEKANTAKDGFLAALSHELRTPLNPVLLIASEAATDETIDPRVRADFAMIAKNVTVESQLIDDLLDLTKISRGKLDLEMRAVDAHDILRDAVGLVNTDIAERRITLDVELEPGSHLFMGDPVRIQQVFWNVLKNAVKFSPENSTVRISSQTIAAGTCLAVHIEDSGIGLTENELSRVFEAFAQGDHASDRGSHRFGGLGLGLAISRTLVELHGGRLRAQSLGRGRGATFTIELPLLAVAPNGVEFARPVALTTKPLRGVRILLVEDHGPTRSTITLLLERRGHRVVAASSVAEARAATRDHKFDLVVSDIGLPDESGYVLMAELREQFGLQGVALSGYGSASDIAKGREAGFLAHLTKPVNVQALDATLASVLRAEPLQDSSAH